MPVKEFVHLERFQNLIFPFIQIKHGEVLRLYSPYGLGGGQGKSYYLV
jgi:hypothetical protein